MTNTNNAATQLEALVQMNLEFSSRERSSATDNEEWFTRNLADDLVFRRASGKVADRTAYIAGLTDARNRSDFIECVIHDVQLEGRVAAVTATVALQGTRAGNPVDGQFMNRRMFWLNHDGTWSCVAWWNDIVPGKTANDDIDGAENALGHYRNPGSSSHHGLDYGSD
jgi:hypothetical protein